MQNGETARGNRLGSLHIENENQLLAPPGCRYGVPGRLEDTRRKMICVAVRALSRRVARRREMMHAMCLGEPMAVAGPGLEPGVAGYEPAVLPLHYPAT